MSHVFMPHQTNRSMVRSLAALGDSYDANDNGIPDDIEAPGLDPIVAAGANTVMTTVIASMRAAISFTRSVANASQYAAIAPPPPTMWQALLGPVYEVAGLVAGAVNYADGAFANRRDAYLSALNTMSTVTNKLDGPDRADVLSTALPLRKWLDAALIVQEGIYGVLKDIGADLSTPTDLWNDIQNGYDWIKQQAGKLPDPTSPWTWLKWGIPLAILGGFALSVAFAPEISGATAAVRAGRESARRLVSAAKAEAEKVKAAHQAARGSQINGLFEDREARRKRRRRSRR